MESRVSGRIWRVARATGASILCVLVTFNKDIISYTRNDRSRRIVEECNAHVTKVQIQSVLFSREEGLRDVKARIQTRPHISLHRDLQVSCERKNGFGERLFAPNALRKHKVNIIIHLHVWGNDKDSVAHAFQTLCKHPLDQALRVHVRVVK